ncbi:MAG: NADH-quinone oxidoreductase subunit NuoG [Nitrospirae bacterium]|nr:NADH-quinone oxidoreductase subunit NuoG [Nitrospirota bacterium]
MIKLTIDGKEIELEEQVTVLEAARRAGIKIPTLCYFEGLKPFGGCRLCLVEVEKLPRLQTACTLMAADGMVVKTETEKIKAARRAILEFLLINHPLDCPVCDKAGECELQDLVARYGPDAGRFTEGKRHHPESFDDPIIVRNMERCVLCTRCIRMCEDLQGAYAITVTGRGSHSFVEPFSGGRYNCEYCGNCLTVCPVGAIMSRLHRHSYRPWFVEKEVETVCGYCGVGCSMVMQMREGKIIRTIPRMGLGLNNGLLCVRGRFGYDYLQSEQRLRSPLIRRDGELHEVSWSEALDYVASRLKEIKEKHGPQAIGAIGSGRCTNEDNYMLQRLMRFTIGTNNIDSSARLYYAPALLMLEGILGQGITANLIPGIKNADGVVVLGGDPTQINPILGLQIRAASRDGAKVITLGRAKGLERFAHIMLPGAPSNVDVVLGMIIQELREGVELKGENKWLQEQLSKVKVTEPIEGIPLDETIGALREMKNAVLVLGPEVLQSDNSDRTLLLVAALVYLLDARVFLLSERPNYQGAMDMGVLPDMLPGGRPLEMFKQKAEEALGREVPADRGLNLFEMIDAASEGRLKALYVMGENPVFNMPDKDRITEALKKLEFLVVQDIFLTETALMADVVLPARAWSERTGTYTNLERRIQFIRSGTDSADGMEDWRILEEISARLGEEKRFAILDEVWEEVVHVSPLHSGLGYDDIKDGKAIWPYKGEPLRGVEETYEIQGLDNIRPIKSGQVLQLDRPLYHSGSISRHSKALRSIEDEAFIVISTKKAEGLGLADGDIVKLITDRGSLQARIKIDSTVDEDNIYISNTFTEANFGSLSGYEAGRLGSLSLDKNPVKLEKV